MISTAPSHHSIAVIALVLVCSLLGVLPAQADLEQREAEWRTPGASELAAQRRNIQRAMEEVDRLLQNAPQGAQWKQYLLWETLAGAIASDVDKDVELQLTAMSDLWGVYARMTRNHPGLELPAFDRLRSEIRVRIQQLNAVLTRRGPAEAAARRARLRQLAAKQRWNGIEQSEWINHVRWLEDRLQPTFYEPPSARFPNLYVSVGTRLIHAATSTPQSDITDVNACIVGTRVVGSGLMTGQGWLTPIESRHDARFIVRFRGSLVSDTVGYNGPVRIFSDGFTQLEGNAELRMSSIGPEVTGIHADAAATSRTKGVATNFNGLLDRLVRRVAYRQIAARRAEANAESSRKALEEFRERFGEEVREQVGRADAQFQQSLRLPLMRRGLLPEHWDWRTEPSGLVTQLHFSGRQRPTAFAPPPRFQGGRDVRAGFHQSFFENAVEGYLAGRLLTLDELAPEGAADDPSLTSDAAIRLDDFQPVRCVFEQDKVALILFGRQFISGGVEYPAAAITVLYQIAHTPQGWKLVRDRSSRVVPIPQYSRNARFGIGGAALRSAIEPVLREELPREIDLELPDLANPLPGPVAQLRVVQVTARNGWFQVGLEMPQN